MCQCGCSSSQDRQQLLQCGGEMGATGGHLLELAGDAEVDPKTQQALVTMAKAVASATAALVTNARNVAAKCDDQALQNQVIVSAKQTALATQALIACTKVCAVGWNSSVYSVQAPRSVLCGGVAVCIVCTMYKLLEVLPVVCV